MEQLTCIHSRSRIRGRGGRPRHLLPEGFQRRVWIVSVVTRLAGHGVLLWEGVFWARF